MKLINTGAGLLAALALSSLTFSAAAQTRTADVSITNLTSGITFRPFLVVASDADTHLFQVGQPASSALQPMAECGGIDMLVAEAQACLLYTSPSPRD